MTTLGIDAGGSHIRAKALDSQGVVVFEGTARSANLTSTPEVEIRQNIALALDGCPDVTTVVAGFAGVGKPAGAKLARNLLSERFPTAAVHLFPDYEILLWTAPATCTAIVILGTGSVVCSWTHDHRAVSSGGTGPFLGDHLSASRLGAAVISHYLDERTEAPEALGNSIHAEAGSLDRSSLIAFVHQNPPPAAALGRLGPRLTEAAERDEAWAIEVLHSESVRLAGTAKRHIDRYHPGVEVPVVGLAGPIWHSAVVRKEFAAALGFVTEILITPAVDGAARASRSIQAERGAS